MKLVRATAADDHAVIGHVADSVVGDFVVATLCDEDRGRVQQQFANVVDVVVVDDVVFIYVFRAWAITTEHNASTAQVM